MIPRELQQKKKNNVPEGFCHISRITRRAANFKKIEKETLKANLEREVKDTAATLEVEEEPLKPNAM